jgi:hypothetical protein
VSQVDRASLVAVKLAALVRDRWGAVDGEPGPFPGGATSRAGATGWVLLEQRVERRLGGALAWARHHEVADLHLLVDQPGPAAAVLARRTAQFAAPPRVWRVDGRSLVEADPAPPPTPVVPPPTAELLGAMLADAGLEVVVERGELVGEVLGLEVARVRPADAASGSGDPDGSGHPGDHGADVHLEVGVGRFDRAAFAMMHPELGDAAALDVAVAVVRRYRRPGAPHHQLNQLVPERWLRAELVADPGIVGAATLSPVESAVPRRDLTERVPATAVGTDGDGGRLVVTCSVGVDLDVVPTGADDRLAHAPGARLVVAVPPRDAVPITTALAGALAEPATVVAVTGGWGDER